MNWIVRSGGTSLLAPQRISQRNSVRVSLLFKPGFSSRRFYQASTEKSFAEELQRPPLLGPVLFAIGLSGGTLGIAAHLTNRDTEKWTKKLLNVSMWGMSGPPTSEDLRRARHLQLFASLKKGLDSAKGFFGESPNYVSKVALYTYAMCAQKWANSAEGRQICRTVIAVNSVVWLAWQIPRLRPIMTRHFLHYPLSGLSHTLLTCVFSHKNFLHLLFNSLALSGFGSAAFLYLAMQQSQSPTRLQESTPQYHFLSFFISAGLFSSLVSHVVNVRFHFPRLLSRLASTGATTVIPASAVVASTAAQQAASIPTILPSLGASGAIWACVSLSALAFPDARMSLVLPTSFAIPIQVGTAGLLALDVMGVVRGWRFFDHWAHLGGAMFGALYYMYGPRVWDAARVYTRPHQVLNDR